MNKILTICVTLIAESSILLASETASVTVEENTGDGFYLGAGFGASFYNVTMTKTDYYVVDGENPTYHFTADDIDRLNDTSEGYLFYAGYQFNKIIAVEASYTDYGVFETSIKERTYTKHPKSMAVYANAGYTFLNGQLRPFGLLGLAYLQTNQSCAYDKLDAFSDDTFVSMHIGTGLDYYPSVFHGFGFRVSVAADSYYEGRSIAYEVTTDDRVTNLGIWQSNVLLYIGAQYKF